LNRLAPIARLTAPFVCFSTCAAWDPSLRPSMTPTAKLPLSGNSGFANAIFMLSSAIAAGDAQPVLLTVGSF
jgi:hypothetical protein